VATPADTTLSWRFGLFEVDARREELRRSGVPVKMREQPFRILVFLLEHAGEIVTREDLCKVLWSGDTFVDFDHSLNTAVMKLREALGDTAEKPLYVETIPKRGYRFIAPISVATSPQNCVASSDGESAIRQASRDNATSQAATAGVSVRGGRTWQIALVSGFLFLAAVALVVFLWKRNLLITKHETGEPSSNFHISPVTSASGLAFDLALSPDGREVVYTWLTPERKHADLYEILIGSDTPLRIAEDKGGLIRSPSWSPDGRVIAFSRCDGKEGAIYIVPALGGTERRLTSVGCPYNAPFRLAWTPDGNQLLMIDHCSTTGPFGLVLFSLLTGEKKCLRDSIDDFSLSPDGSTVAFTPMINSVPTFEIYTIPLAGGAQHLVVKDDSYCGGLMWTPDERAIVFYSIRSTQSSLWRVSSTGGEMQRETIYPALGSFSKDGRRFVYADSATGEPFQVWRADLTSPGGHVLKNRKLVSTQFGDLDAQPSPDGRRIVWASFRTGPAEIWVSDATGTSPLQLTHLGLYSGTPRWSPDGKWIAFDIHKSNGVQIYTVDSEGRNLHAVTGGPYPNVVPSWSRDGEWIYFVSKRTGSWEVWKHSLKSGKEVQLTTNGGFDPIESYDGRTIYFSKFDEAGIWSVPSEGGRESLVIANKPQVTYWGHWAITESGLYLLDAEAEPRPRIEFYDFATRRISPVLTIEKRAALGQPSLSATADGKTIYYTQLDPQSVIKMMEFSN
jgi:Tol biopolymer transport system component/DNA-binding winged helix-turn-helix (wHTH) protein